MTWRNDKVLIPRRAFLGLILTAGLVLAGLAVGAAIGLSLLFGEPPATLVIAFGLIIVARVLLWLAQDVRRHVRRRARRRRLRDRRAGT